MGRYLVISIISQVVDSSTISDERAAHVAAEANITLGGASTVAQKAITGSTVRGAATETNASLTSKHHG